MEDEKEKTISPSKMPKSPLSDESVGADSDPQSKIVGRPSINSSHDGNPAKSCKGCLYYSSRLRAENRNPLCIGITRSLPIVPQHIVGESEMEASKQGRSLTDFRYSCVGYSMYTDRKGENDSSTRLPVCVGLEVLVDRRVHSASAPAHIHHKGDAGNHLPQRRSAQPTDQTAEEFFSRFIRSVNLVAHRVVKNGRRVGNQMKQALDYLFYPNRRPPK